MRAIIQGTNHCMHYALLVKKQFLISRCSMAHHVTEPVQAAPHAAAARVPKACTLLAAVCFAFWIMQVDLLPRTKLCPSNAALCTTLRHLGATAPCRGRTCNMWRPFDPKYMVYHADVLAIVHSRV